MTFLEAQTGVETTARPSTHSNGSNNPARNRASNKLSDYEKERDKPMPSRNHALIQNRLSFLLQRDYDKPFDFLSELELEMQPKNAVPDICIYPKMKMNFETDIVKMTEMPLTTIEILSPKQALDDVVSKIRSRYFPLGIQSAWLVLPTLNTIYLLLPDKKPKPFTSGDLIDPTTKIKISVDEVFAR